MPDVKLAEGAAIRGIGQIIARKRKRLDILRVELAALEGAVDEIERGRITPAGLAALEGETT